jgi:hypothetical protein
MAYQLAFIEGDFVDPDGVRWHDVEVSLMAEKAALRELKKMSDAGWMAHVMMLDASMDGILNRLLFKVGTTEKFVGKMSYGFCSFEIKCTGKREVTIMSFDKEATSDEYLDAINEKLNLVKYEDFIKA